MWLKDFLPEQLVDHHNVRIMIYGYDSRLVGHHLSQFDIADYRKQLVALLTTVRYSQEVHFTDLAAGNLISAFTNVILGTRRFLGR